MNALHHMRIFISLVVVLLGATTNCIKAWTIPNPFGTTPSTITQKPCDHPQKKSLLSTFGSENNENVRGMKPDVNPLDLFASSAAAAALIIFNIQPLVANADEYDAIQNNGEVTPTPVVPTIEVAPKQQQLQQASDLLSDSVLEQSMKVNDDELSDYIDELSKSAANSQQQSEATEVPAVLDPPVEKNIEEETTSLGGKSDVEKSDPTMTPPQPQEIQLKPEHEQSTTETTITTSTPASVEMGPSVSPSPMETATSTPLEQKHEEEDKGTIASEPPSYTVVEQLPTEAKTPLKEEEHMTEQPSTTPTDSAVVEQEEKEIIAEIILDEKDEDEATKDTQKLIIQLEEQIKEEKEADKIDDAEIKQTSTTTKELIDALEKEEEKIESETKDIITKIETLEETVQQQQQQQQQQPQEAEQQQTEQQQLKQIQQQEVAPAPPPTPSAPDEATTQEFLSKLQQRLDEKEDLISRLKAQSQKDIDPKTGKYKYMTRREFYNRAPDDFDFLDYLKDSVTHNEEFKRDLEAFEHMLEDRLGGVTKILN